MHFWSWAVHHQRYAHVILNIAHTIPSKCVKSCSRCCYWSLQTRVIPRSDVGFGSVCCSLLVLCEIKKSKGVVLKGPSPIWCVDLEAKNAAGLTALQVLPQPPVTNFLSNRSSDPKNRADFEELLAPRWYAPVYAADDTCTSPASVGPAWSPDVKYSGVIVCTEGHYRLLRWSLTYC